MSDSKREQLSAFMDGELENESGRIIDHLLSDENSRHTWMRYHIIAESMRHSLPSRLNCRLPSEISAKLKDEPVTLAPARKKMPAYLKPVAGLAIAASVAGVAVISVQQRQDSGPVAAGSEVATVAPNFPAERQFRYPARPASIDNARPASTAAAATNQSPRQHRLNSRMNNYLINYNEYHANAGMQGMLPYVRIVAHDRND